MTSPEQDLHSFIRATFRSVWAIELLCHVRDHVRARPEQPLQIDGIVAALRASRLVVERGLADLSAAGLTSVDDAGQVRYQPASADLDALAGAAEAFYARSPDAVRRMIVAAANPGVTAFADAFKLRRD